MNSPRLHYQPHIDGLRAVAVLAVLGFHAFPQVRWGGFVGVDIFFVISGFLISSILYADFEPVGASGGAVIARFYGRRIRRIFPALIVVLVACYLLGFYLLVPGELEKLSLDVVASAGFCLNLILSGQTDYFNNDAASNPLLHLWSLGIEEQFYLVWPLVIWGAAKCRIRILPTVVFLAACSFFWNARSFATEAAATFYLPHMRLWELATGAITAAILPDLTRVLAGSRAGVAHALSFLGFALIGAGFVIIDSEMERLNAWMLLPTTGAALVIVSGGSAWLNRTILAQRHLVWIGLISYPLYLWHWPLLTFARLGNDEPNTPPVVIGILAGSVLLAWLTYRLVEIPVRRARRSWVLPTALAGVMAAVGGLGYYSKVAGGFPARFPRLLNEISAYQYDPAPFVRQGTYFLNGDQDETNFQRDPAEIDPDKPTIYLWGDSHAASLYPGLSHVLGQRYNIVQRTTAKTPPFLPEFFNPGNARQINQFVLDSIRQTRPEYVVLHANWPEYKWSQIEATITALRAAGIRHVVLVGPVPRWIGSLPQQLFNYARKHRDEPVPVRMKLGQDPGPAELDPLMAALAQQAGADYVSACRILGNEEGVLVRTGDTADSLTTYDSSHLTVGGSRYLVAGFPGFKP